MKKPLWAGLKLPLKTSKEIVWSVLTEPKYTRQYMYNCALKCNWSAGNEAQWVEQHPKGSGNSSRTRRAIRVRTV